MPALLSSDPYAFQFVEEWAAAVISGNLDEILPLYCEQAVLVATFSDSPMRGTDSLTAYFTALLGDHPNLDVEILNGEINQNLGEGRCLTGTYRFIWGTCIEDMATVDARYTFVVRDDGDKWLAHTHHSSVFPTRKRT
jgi:uncharacterized protein (TIGR02246 family)